MQQPCATARQLRDRGMRDDARQAGIVEGQGGPSERPVLTISGSGEGGRKRGGTPGLNIILPFAGLFNYSY